MNELVMLPADLLPGIQNTAFSQKNGIQPKRTTTYFSILIFEGGGHNVALCTGICHWNRVTIVGQISYIN
jgi:hypothetical protein